MLEIDVRLSLDVYDELAGVVAACSGAAELPDALTRWVAGQPALGAQRARIVADLDGWFDLPRMPDRDFWAGQRKLRDTIEQRLDATVSTIRAALPRVPDHRVVPVEVFPVPGLTACYGASGGGQLFGLYHGADPREMLLFLSHTYYHELSETLTTEAGREAEADPSTPERFRRWLWLLIRHEGIANYAVLEQLRSLRDEGVAFQYFRYAPLIDNVDATARAMVACRQLDAMLDKQTVDRVRARVNTTLKNYRLPVVNLIGIHMAEAIARRYGERVLLDVDQVEPEEFRDLYARTDDPLRETLLGPRAAGQPVLGGTG